MKNMFRVTNFRFHALNERRLLIQGWFKENEQGENTLLVCLDQKKLKFTIEKYAEVASAKECAEVSLVIRNRYNLWVDLPREWETYKKIQVFNFNNKIGGEAFRVTTGKLKLIRKKLNRYVESVASDQTGFSISGWYVSPRKVEVKVFDEKDKELPVEVKYGHKSDVLLQYPECSDKEVVGFNLSYKGSVSTRVRVHLEDSEKCADDWLNLKPTVVKKETERVKKWGIKTYAYYQKFGVKRTVKRLQEKLFRRENTSYQSWLRAHQPGKDKLKEQEKKEFVYQPKLSIVVPLYKTPINYLEDMVESVRRQSYSNWELCLSDGSGSNSHLKERLMKFEASDSRIKVVHNDSTLKISENTNRALELTTGDYIAFVDHDDLLAPDALYECVCAFNRNREIDVLYTDEDKVSMNGKMHFQPHFKPDFNIDMLRSMNYICHLFVVKRAIFQEVGGLNPQFDGAQDYDFVLRCVERAKCIKHIPKILYHWRAHRGSTAENPESKSYAFEAGAHAIQAHFERLSINVAVTRGECPGIYRSKYSLTEKPLVSVIIPNKDHIEDLDKCLSSLNNRSAYENLEYIIVENNSEREETFQYYEKIQKENDKVNVVYWKKEFNYSAINNFGVQTAKGEYFLFLNNDTEVINEDCIEELLGYALREDVGAVGAKLYYEDDTIQHAGVVVGMGEVAGHVFTGEPKGAVGYFWRILVAQDYSAVTAACMMVKRKAYEAAGGFDEALAIAFNDVDFCLRIREAGFLVVYNPFAQLYHYESKSRGLEDTEKKIRRFQKEIALFKSRWAQFMEQGDPAYNPNLTLDKNDFSLKMK